MSEKIKALLILLKQILVKFVFIILRVSYISTVKTEKTIVVLFYFLISSTYKIKLISRVKNNNSVLLIVTD